MVVVEIKCGKLEGKVCSSLTGKQYYTFHNIPYAQPPIGELRFKAPQPPQCWEGIRDATKAGQEYISKQSTTKEIVGSEDCLQLSVYTTQLPEVNKRAPLKPVMFWIHGGFFASLSTTVEYFGPDFLLEEDVVVVAINYRLGILGFLSLDDSSLGVPGNAGYKDMVMALKWVQGNIAQFCGDPNNVTIFGSSAGALAVHLLMLSKMSKGLFHKAIAQSACALNIWAEGRRSARIIARKLGFYNTDDKKILEFLNSMSAEMFLDAQKNIDADDFIDYEKHFIGFVVERPSNEEAFLNRQPIDIILSGDYNHVPFIIGYNFREGMAIDDVVPARRRQRMFQNMELSIPLGLNLERGSRLSLDLAEKVKEVFYGNVQRNRQTHAIQYADLYTHVSFFREMYFIVKQHLKTSKQPIYFYQFTLETQLNIFKKLVKNTTPGVYHGDEISYLFKSMMTPKILPGSIEEKSMKKMTKLWTNFARYGDPTPTSSKDFLEVKWNPVNSNDFNYLEIGENLSEKINLEKEKMALWKEIFDVNPCFFQL